MELNDKVIARVSAAMAVAGFIALILLSQEGQSTDLGEISRQLVGKKIITQGIALNPALREQNLFFTLAGKQKIKVVEFKSQTRKEDIENRLVEVQGTVKTYKGELEIIAEKIRVLR